MSPGITLLLLLAALMHAVWNALVKGARDNVAMATWAYSVNGFAMAPLLFFLPPLPVEGFRYIAAHFVLHTGYKVLLLQMYRHGDFSQVFPIARGVAPLLITLIAIPAAGELPAPLAFAGVGVISLGILVFALEPAALTRAGVVPVLLALGAGLVLSGYAVVDALGVRLDGAGLTYFIWLFLVDAISMLAIGLYWRPRTLLAALRDEWRPGALAAVLSAANFGIVLWVMSFNPIGLSAAVREFSIVLAALIGTLFFREAFGPRRIVAALVILTGIVLINA